MDLRGECSSGGLSQQEQVSRFVPLIGEAEAFPVFRRSSMAPSRQAIPQSKSTELYTIELPVSQPITYGPVRQITVVEPEPPPILHA